MKLINLIFCLILTVLLLLSSLLIPLIPDVSLEAATNWTKSDVTIQNEKYIIDSYVIKDDTTYKMWYTHLLTDLSIDQLYNAVKELNIYDLLDKLLAYDFDGFFNGLSGLTPDDLSNVKDIFDGIGTTVGYATSNDGKSWAIQDSNVFSGYSDSIWTSIGFPSIIKVDTDDYRMWYTRLETTLTQPQLENVFIDLGSPTLSDRKAAIESILNSTRTVIGYATSTDGYSDWVEQNPTAFANTGGVYLLDSVYAPSVIKDDSVYKLWYSRIETGLNSTNLDSLLTDIQSGTVDMSNLMSILSDASSVIGYAISSDDGQTFVDENNKVLPGSSIPDPALWQGVADPYVVKTSSGYEMWYMNGTTNLVQGTLLDAINEVRGWGISSLWNSLKTKTLGDFIEQDLKNIDVTGLETILNDTSALIGYAISSDGQSWVVQSTDDLVGEQTTPWSSVGAPSIVKSTSIKEIWYSKGIPSLTWQNVADRIMGDNSGLGYASVSTGGGGGGGGGGIRQEPPPIAGTGEVCWPLTPEGYTPLNIILTSEDEICTVLIPKGSITWTEDYQNLTCIYCNLMESPPEPPEEKVIRIAYDIGPDGAMFPTSVTVAIKYSQLNIPADVDEASLDLVYFNAIEEVWTSLNNVEIDTENQIISGKTKHLTAYGIISDIGTETEPSEPEEPPETPPEVTPPILGPAAFVTSALTISPSVVEIGELVTIDVIVTNVGEQIGTYNIVLMINNLVSDTKNITLRTGESKTVTFIMSESIAGTYNVVIDKLSGSFIVKATEEPTEIPEEPTIPEPKPINWWIIAGSIVLGIVIVVVTGWFILTRRENI